MLKRIIILIISILLVSIATGALYLNTFHLTIIKVNPFENKTEISEKKVHTINIIEVEENVSVREHLESGRAKIVEETFTKSLSNCIEINKAEEIAFNIVLNNNKSKKFLSDLIKEYGDIVIEFHERLGTAKVESGKYIKKVCTGELEIYPKDFHSRKIIVKTNVNLINKTLYPVQTLCDRVLDYFCIRYVDLKLGNPTDEEKEFVKKVLKEKGYDWEKINIAVKQLYTKLPNGTLIPSSVIYWIILEKDVKNKIHRAIILSFSSDEEIEERSAYVIINLNHQTNSN